jgi:hypothetical protein
MLAACLNGRISHGTTALLYSHGMVFPVREGPGRFPVITRKLARMHAWRYWQRWLTTGELSVGDGLRRLG